MRDPDLSQRLLRVAMLGHVPTDDPHVIADAQAEIARAPPRAGGKMNLPEFARWTIENSAFAGCDLNGGDVQEKAAACGLLTETTYDPALHGGSDCAEPGDRWFVYSEAFRKALEGK